MLWRYQSCIHLSRVSVRTWTPIRCLMVAFSRGEFTVQAITLTYSYVKGYFTTRYPHPSSLPVENKLPRYHCLVDKHSREADHPPDDIVQQPRSENICGSSCMLGNTSEPWPEGAICAFIYRGREEIWSSGEGTHYIRICGPGQPNIRIFTANEQW